MELPINKIIFGDALEILKTLPDECVDCVVTSPPYYGLRDYGISGQIGLEKNLNEYFDKLLAITAELYRVLKKEGTMFWNHGDGYASKGSQDTKFFHGKNKGKHQLSRDPIQGRARVEGYMAKCLLLQAHRLAIRMVDEQKWILRNILIWSKPNAMPSSVKDRFGVDYEPMFFFSKSKKYYFEQQFEKSIWYEKDKRAITGGKTKSGKSITNQGNQYSINKSGSFNQSYPGNRNKRCVWTIPTKPFPEAHFAVFPEALIETPIKAGCPKGGIVLDPFIGSGTTAIVAKKLGRNYIGIDLNPSYCEMAVKRISQILL